LPRILNVVVDGAIQALSADRVTLITLDQEAERVVQFVCGGAGADQVVQVDYEELMEGMTGWVLREGRPAFSPKGEPDSRESEKTMRRRAETNCGSIIVVPLAYRDRTIGTMTAINRPDQRDFNQEDVEMMQAMASQAAIAIENAQLFDEMQRQAVTDPLTALYNRRGLFELGQREIERAHRFERSLSAMMLDIDHFKYTNDRFGHYVGDQVLQALAERCRIVMRKVDLLARYGGEEFAMLLPETDLEAAEQVAERLREAIADQPIKTGRGLLDITVSIGVAPYTDETVDLVALLDSADGAMYAAKRAGRNCVFVKDTRR
jgi:diguanylate cyclase (GGDEF)-like protein